MNDVLRAKRSIISSLIGLTIAWLFFIAANFFDVLVNLNQQSTQVFTEREVRVSTYLYFIAITSLAIAGLLGQRLALAIRANNDFPLARAAHRFNNLAIILSLVAGAIFAIGNFLGAFGGYDRDAPGLVRVFGVYVPIVLATALVVTTLLFGFVFRKDAPDLKNERDEDLAKKQRAVGLAYASPVLGTAVAILFGLAVYDITRTELDVWIWVIIQLIIAVSILIGTRFAAMARLATNATPKPRQAGVAAVNLNFVLSIVFGVVVTSMAFGFGAGAIDSLVDWELYWDVRTPIEEGAKADFIPPSLKSADLAWWLGDLLPAVVLLVLAELGIYKSLVTRNTEANA